MTLHARDSYGVPMDASLRVVVGEDDVLLREGISRLLTESGFSIAGQAGDAADLVRKGLAHHPDVVITDIHMPPGDGDDGLAAALEIRRQRPETGVLLLSQFYEDSYALELIGDRPEGVGYLLKERIGDVESFVDAITRVAAGGHGARYRDRGAHAGAPPRDVLIDRLSPREREVLAAMAEGRSNRGIAAALLISQAAVEKHVTRIFQTLQLDATRPIIAGCSRYSSTCTTRPGPSLQRPGRRRRPVTH